MTEKEKQEPSCEEATSVGEQAAEAADLQPQPAEDAAEEVTRLKQENSELEERLLRLRADFDNFRKRSRQQLAESRVLAIETFAAPLLPVIDNLERALAAAPETEDSSLRTGVEMIRRQLLDVLAQEEIKPIVAVGQQFDPLRHEAVSSEDTDQAAAGTIMEEYVRGYQFGQKVLRCSKVKVAQAKESGKDEIEDE